MSSNVAVSLRRHSGMQTAFLCRLVMTQTRETPASPTYPPGSSVVAALLPGRMRKSISQRLKKKKRLAVSELSQTDFEAERNQQEPHGQPQYGRQQLATIVQRLWRNRT